MKTSTAGVHLALLAASLTAVTACSTDDDQPPSQTEDLIRMVGHGRYLGRGYTLLEPSPELFERTQRSLLDRLGEEARAAGVDVEVERARIARGTKDTFLANAALIDALLDAAPPGDHATIRQVNGAMRADYVRTLPAGSAEVAAIPRVTFNSGDKYIEECRAAGVPIPPPMYKTGAGNWQPRGSLTTNFLGGDAQLWEYRSSAGICLALPRYDSDTSGAKPFGVICVGTGTGTGTNKACFWDNKYGVPMPRNVEAPLTNFVGGYDLAYNNQGVCSDCHAGANPFIVHPGDPAFATIVGRDQTPTGWYEPIVHSNWPQNRGPSNMLAGIASEGRCDGMGCHASVRDGGRSGQFPILSTELQGYCDTVLELAALGPSPQTMPSGPAFEPHRRVMRDACRSKPDDGNVVIGPSPGNPTFLSPPSLQATVYDCAQKVEVNNVALRATVTLTVNGTSYTQVAQNVAHIEFAVSTPFAVGDVITASQSVDGLTSATTTLVVRDHHLDFGTTIPAPAINPDLVYECADVVAVTHVPGALVTVDSSFGGSVSGWTSTGWSSFYFGSSFTTGQRFRARASLCPSEPASDWSPSITAVAAPSVMPTPTFDPERAYDGQELVSIGNLANGSRTSFRVNGAAAGNLDVPISWWPNFNLATALGRALRDGDTVTARPKLCDSAPTTSIPVSKCGELPAPRIETPLFAGARAVVVRLAQPGARIHVYDASGIEIGNGSGVTINLSRALVATDVLQIVQQLGACRSATAHQVYVRAPGQ